MFSRAFITNITLVALLFTIFNNQDMCQGSSINVFDVGLPVFDNLILFASTLRVECSCFNELFSTIVAVDENLKLGEHRCSCQRVIFSVPYRTCTIDEYVAFQRCPNASNSNICIRVQNSVKREDPCRAMTNLMKKHYCLPALNRNFSIYYGMQRYDSLCNLLADSPTLLNFNRNFDFNIMGRMHLFIPEVSRRITIYKVIKTSSVRGCSDLQSGSQGKIHSSHLNIRRLLAGETVLLDKRTLICFVCSKPHFYMLNVTFYEKNSDFIKHMHLHDQPCTTIERLISIDMMKVIEEAQYLTHVRVGILFFEERTYSPFAHFGFRLIISEFPISLAFNNQGCPESSTSLLVCSVSLPRAASFYTGMESISWLRNGKMIPNDSAAIIFREQIDETSSIYVHSSGDYTCQVAVRVYLTFPSKIEIVHRTASRRVHKLCTTVNSSPTPPKRDVHINHTVAIMILALIALTLTGVCILVIKCKPRILRDGRRNKTCSLTILPVKLITKSAQNRTCGSHDHSRDT